MYDGQWTLIFIPVKN